MSKLHSRIRAIAAVLLASSVVISSGSMVFALQSQEVKSPDPKSQEFRVQSPLIEVGKISAEQAGDSTGIVQQPPAQSQEQNPITQPLALSPEVTNKRVGVDENNRQLLTLHDAIVLALQKNLGIEMSRQNVQIAQHSLTASRGAYDILSSSQIGYTNQTRPVSNIFGGGGAGSSFTSQGLTYNFSTGQEVERTAGRWQVDFQNSRTNSTNTANTLNPIFNSFLTATYTQPVGRDLSLDANRRAIRLARRQLDISDSQFRQSVIETISEVQRAYWDLVFSIRNEKIAREAVELARVQLDNNRKQVEAGTVAPIDLRSTEAALESRKGDVIVALQQITISENALKALLINDHKDRLWSAAIEPSDEPELGQSTFSLEEAINLSLRNRPELEQTRIQTEQNQIDIKFFQSQTKPQVDLFGTYSNVGLAGTALPVEIGDNPPMIITPERFQGGFLRALGNVFSQDFRTFEFGVRLSFPWRNNSAQGNLGRALAESRQLDARQRQLVQSIQVEVRNALQAVEAARQRFEAQRANRIASDAQFKGEQERFRAGLTTNFFVLQRQNELSAAKGQELRALTDYNKSLAELQRVTGLTLVSNNVEVPQSREK